MSINVTSSSTLFTNSDAVAQPLQHPKQPADVANKGLEESPLKAVQEAEDSQAYQTEQEPETGQLEQIAEQLSDTMAMMRKGLAFRVDDDSGRNVVSVMDVDSGDVIRQIPSDEALKLAATLSEVAGFLMKTEA